MTKVAGIWNANAESCAPAVADCHSGGGRFGNSLPSGSCSRRLLRTCSKRRSPRRTEKPGSDIFCEIGLAAVCMADYPEHIAPKSP